MSYEKILYNIPKLAVSIDLLYISVSFSIEVMDSGINTRKSKNSIGSSENSFTAFKFRLVQESKFYFICPVKSN